MDYMFRLLLSHLQALLYMIPYCYSNYFVSIGDPTVRLTTLLIGSVFLRA